jgi:pullulanase/glycogen debranching enzyme
MVSYYAADDANGLGIKGSAILNFSKAQSWTKKVRKPEDTIPKILTGGKVALKNLKDNLTTKEGKLTGRMGSEVLLVRVIV